jgi:hypothetical protein
VVCYRRWQSGRWRVTSLLAPKASAKLVGNQH